MLKASPLSFRNSSKKRLPYIFTQKFHRAPFIILSFDPVATSTPNWVNYDADCKFICENQTPTRVTKNLTHVRDWLEFCPAHLIHVVLSSFGALVDTFDHFQKILFSNLISIEPTREKQVVGSVYFH